MTQRIDRKPASRVVLEMLSNRTGPVAMQEIRGYLLANWQFPADFTGSPELWFRSFISDTLVRERLVAIVGHYQNSDRPGKGGLYVITAKGRDFLAQTMKPGKPAGRKREKVHSNNLDVRSPEVAMRSRWLASRRWGTPTGASA